MLAASPQPASEISKLGDVFVEATDELKQAMQLQQAFVEDPVTDHWGTWVSVRMPIKSDAIPPNFYMLNVDVAVNNWNTRILKAIIAPVASTLIFLGILGGFIYQARKREKLLAQLYNSTTALSEIANNDALTGLPNRRLLEDRMMQALKAAKRSDDIVAVLFLDLDFFKTINDTYGYAAGDELLKLAATRLSNLLRSEDTVARIGGDEFVILLPTLADAEQAIIAADKLVKALAKPFTLAQQTVQLAVSVGIALYPQHADEPSDLINRADIAMYAAKRKGRNCHAIYQQD